MSDPGSARTVRALITGGAGCIGSDLAQELLRRGQDVTVLDDLSSGRIEHIQEMLSHPHFHFVQGDLLDQELVNRIMAGVEVVYHMAANSDVRFALGDPTDKDLRQNTLATHAVLEAMRIRGVRRLAFASTSAIYGISEVQPIPESIAPRPISLYGATKLGCEALISAFSSLFGMQCWIFRFANVVGAKIRKKGHTVIVDFISRLREDPRHLTILGDGRQAKSYLLASDCIAAMLHVMDHTDAPLNIYNLGSSDVLPVTRIADMVVNAMGLSGVRYSYTGGSAGWPGDVPRFKLDVTALNRLGWYASHNSEEAVMISIQQLLATLPMSEPAAGRSVCRP